MFTGIIETTATVDRLEPVGAGARLVLSDVGFAGEVGIGESIAVNGCCLTATEIDPVRNSLRFDLLQETLRATNLGQLSPGARVNLERALRAGDRMSGHYVQGHVDAVGRVLDYSADGADHRLEISLPEGFAHLTAYKGSIAVNGISLTIAEAHPDRIVIWIIPHTHAVTNLRDVATGARVNLEFDILAKYVDRMLTERAARLPQPPV